MAQGAKLVTKSGLFLLYFLSLPVERGGVGGLRRYCKVKGEGYGV